MTRQTGSRKACDMDPAQTLLDAEGWMEENPEEATLALLDYARWRFRGGFEPPHGDLKFEELMCAVAEKVSLVTTDEERSDGPR